MKCNCGSNFVYFKSNGARYTGIGLKCLKCDKIAPELRHERKIRLEDLDHIHTKADFAKIIGTKRQSVDNLINKGRVFVVYFAKKEFIYYKPV